MQSGLPIILGGLLALGACADNISHDKPDAAVAVDASGSGSGSGDAPPASGKVSTVRNADATYTTIVDATSMTDWTYVDFETGAEVSPTDAWDLRVQRFHISTNGGVSGSGGVQIAPVTGTTFAALTTPPTSGFVSDINGEDGTPVYAFDQGDGWYDYDPSSHVLSPKPIVYAIETDGGSSLKLEIQKYYDDAGTSGVFTFHWAPL